MIGPGRDIRKQKRGDKSIKTSGYNNMQDLLKALSRGQPDMTSMQLMRVWGSGRAFVGRPPPKIYPSAFDLIRVAAASYEIQAFTGAIGFEGMAWFRGLYVDINAGAGLTYTATDTWTTGTITDATKQWVYLECERVPAPATSPVTIVAAQTLRQGDDDTEVFPLWYIPWDAAVGAITHSGIWDARHSVRLIGMV